MCKWIEKRAFSLPQKMFSFLGKKNAFVFFAFLCTFHATQVTP